MHGLHDQLEHWIENLAPLFGIAFGEPLHRALEVSEEYRDLLALAFQRGFGREDLLGEMLRGVALRRRKAWLRTDGALLAKLGSTGVAKSTTRRIDMATGGTRQLKACSAAVAEAGLGGVVLPALRAAHQ